MDTGIDEIKFFYKDILKKESVCQNINVSITEFVDYVSSVYEEIDNTKFMYFKERLSRFLEINSDEIKKIIMESIYANLYCDILLVLQNLDAKNFRIKREFFLTSLECNDKLKLKISKKCKERFKRRIELNRLNLVKKFKMQSTDEECFYSPTIIRVFKETLFIKRPGTKILDISKNYADIFFALMFDTDEDFEMHKTKNYKDILKSYRLWQLTDDSTNFIFNIYETVMNAPLTGDKFAQLMLLEKLYGLNTTVELFLRKKSSTDIIKTFSRLRKFGYCSLHKLLADKISEKNCDIINSFVCGYIQPFCEQVLSEITQSLLSLLEELNEEQRVEFLKTILSVCKINSKNSFSVFLKCISADKITESIKTITEFVEVNSYKKMENYILNNPLKDISGRFYHPKYIDVMRPKRLFDKSFIDLTFDIRNPKIEKKTLKNLLNEKKLFEKLFPFFLKNKID